MNKQNLISFAIPTYNREKELNECLESIYNFSKENLNSIEIIVSDNNSNDNTLEIINHWKDIFPNFIYKINKMNIGFQKNLIQSLSLANGDYVWILSSDDVISSKYNYSDLNKILNDFSSSIFILNRNIYSKELDFIKEDSYLSKSENFTVNMKAPEEFINYLNLSNTVDSLGCFMSSLILKKTFLKKSMKFKEDSMLLENIFPHVFLTFKTLSLYKKKCNLTYLTKPLINFRKDNSSFLVGDKKFVLAKKQYDSLFQLKNFLDNSKIEESLLNLISKQFKNASVVHFLHKSNSLLSYEYDKNTFKEIKKHIFVNQLDSITDKLIEINESKAKYLFYGEKKLFIFLTKYISNNKLLGNINIPNITNYSFEEYLSLEINELKFENFEYEVKILVQNEFDKNRIIKYFDEKYIEVI